MNDLVSLQMKKFKIAKLIAAQELTANEDEIPLS